MVRRSLVVSVLRAIGEHATSAVAQVSSCIDAAAAAATAAADDDDDWP